MLVISDTSSITNLIQIQQLDILRKLYGTVVITKAVFDELKIIDYQKVILEKADWIIVAQLQNRTLATILEIELDKGEAESIALAVEIDADLLLIDEKKGRRIAKAQGLTIIGLLGVIVEAKNLGIINFVKPLLDDLINKANFRIGIKLYNDVLAAVAEI
jgi:uncharacterized protein